MYPIANLDAIFKYPHVQAILKIPSIQKLLSAGNCRKTWKYYTHITAVNGIFLTAANLLETTIIIDNFRDMNAFFKFSKTLRKKLHILSAQALYFRRKMGVMLKTTRSPRIHRVNKRTFFATKSYHNKDKCLTIFDTACVRLLDPGHRAALAGNEKEIFVLFDQHGENPNRLLQVGEFLRVDLPGPGTSVGEGFDWMQVTKLDKQRNEDGTEEFLVITMHPSHPPKKI